MIGNDATPLVRCLLRAAQRGRQLRAEREAAEREHAQAITKRGDDDGNRQPQNDPRGHEVDQDG